MEETTNKSTVVYAFGTAIAKLDDTAFDFDDYLHFNSGLVLFANYDDAFREFKQTVSDAVQDIRAGVAESIENEDDDALEQIDSFLQDVMCNMNTYLELEEYGLTLDFDHKDHGCLRFIICDSENGYKSMASLVPKEIQ